MFDMVIRGGMIVDGSGKDRRRGDVAVKDGRIVALGDIGPADAKTVIDADGLIVAPGFIDVHTHYDAQLFWDPTASPSPYHGVTTVIGGLCGFTLQPITRKSVDYIVPMLSQVEDIPLVSLQSAVPCDWDGFAEYQAQLSGRIAVNAAFATGHSAIRHYVMGERAMTEQASADDLARMQDLLRAQLEAGSIGFSTSNSTTHTDHHGDAVPSRQAAHEEFVELARVCSEYEGTIVEIQPGLDFDDKAAQLMADMSVASERIVNWNAQFIGALDPMERDQIQRQLAMTDYVRARGGDLIGLSVPVSANAHIDMLRGAGFAIIPGWAKPFGLPVEERLAAFRDPAVRQTLRDAAFAPEAMKIQIVTQLMDPDYLIVEKGLSARTRAVEGKSMREVADLWGIDPFNVMFDIALEDDLRTLFTFRTVGDDAETYAFRARLWRDSRMILGGSDAGAHVETIDTFGYFTQVLDKAVRRYGVASLEEVIHYFTQTPADLVGLRDRGLLREGWRADITIFDEKTVASLPLEMRNDLPGGAGRLYAGATGIRCVIVNGEVVIDDGVYTGALPGEVLQRGKDTRTVPIPRYLEAAE
ncbi:MAG: amidohydrolase family protein [Sphingobium sp.]